MRTGRLFHSIAPVYLADLMPSWVVLTLLTKMFSLEACHVWYLCTDCTGVRSLKSKQAVDLICRILVSFDCYCCNDLSLHIL